MMNPTAQSRMPIPADALANFCRKWGIQKLELFGSILRDDFRRGQRGNQSAERGSSRSSEFRVQSTEFRVQSSKFRVQSAEDRVPRTE